MCGIFGLVRHSNARHPERATAVLAELGKHSISRGRDSAGIAYIPFNGTSSSTPVISRDAREKVATLSGGVVVVKDTKTFDRVWDDERDISLASRAGVMIGHTRAATQGSRTDLANASPLAVGTLVGSHNGDIDTDTVQSWLETKDRVKFGGTDTEHLYRAMSNVKSHRGKVVKILEAIHGRAALAWYDRRLPGRIFLARAGLSPMAIAYDRDGNMYWASNPDWFRKIDAHFNGQIGFERIFIVPEGTLFTVHFGDGSPEITDHRLFKPTVRFSDETMPESIVWRDFTIDDKKADKDNASHDVAPAPVVTTSSYSGRSYGRTLDWTSTSLGSSEDDEDYEWLSARNDTPWDTYRDGCDLFPDGVYPAELEDRLDIEQDEEDYFKLRDEIIDEILAYSSPDEIYEASKMAQEFFRLEVQGSASNEARAAMFKAKEASNYSSIIKDFGLSNGKVARAFVTLVLHNITT